MNRIRLAEKCRSQHKRLKVCKNVLEWCLQGMVVTDSQLRNVIEILIMDIEKELEEEGPL
jgi:hypothetical protein